MRTEDEIRKAIAFMDSCVRGGERLGDDNNTRVAQSARDALRWVLNEDDAFQGMVAAMDVME